MHRSTRSSPIISALLLLACTGCGNDATNELHRLATSGTLGAPTTARVVANVLYVPATIDGVSGGSLLVDSGAPVTVIGPSHWPGAPLPSGLTTISTLALGDLTLHNVPAIDAELFDPGAMDAPGGIFGANIFCQFPTLFDYRDKTVRLGGHLTDVQDVGAPVAIPFHAQGGGLSMFQGQTVSFPPTRIAVQVMVDGTLHNAIIDTGASYAVLRDAAWKALASDGRPTLTGLPIQSAAGPISGTLTRARTMNLMGASDLVVEQAPVLDIGDTLLDGLSREVGHPVDALVGGTFLRNFLVDLDYLGGALTLARYNTETHIDPDEFHQIGAMIAPVPTAGGTRYVISHLFAGTDAANKLTEGDEVIAIDGQALGSLDEPSAEMLLHGAVGSSKTVKTAGATELVLVEDLLPPA